MSGAGDGETETKDCMIGEELLGGAIGVASDSCFFNNSFSCERSFFL